MNHPEIEPPAVSARVFTTLLRFRRLMARLLVLLLGLVVLGMVGLRRGTATWAVQTVFAGAALAALAMLLAPLAMAWLVRKR